MAIGGREAIRRSRMLYNHPVSLGIDYFVNNSKDRKGAKIDVEGGGFLKHKAGPKIEEKGINFKG